MLNVPNTKRSNYMRDRRVVNGAFNRQRKGRPRPQLRLQPEVKVKDIKRGQNTVVNLKSTIIYVKRG